MRVEWVNVEWAFQGAMGDLLHGFAGGQERIVEAAGEPLLTGHAEPLSSASFCTFSNASVSRDRTACLNSIFSWIQKIGGVQVWLPIFGPTDTDV